MASHDIGIARARLGQVYRFLKAMDQRRNIPVRDIGKQDWALWLRQLPDHPAVQRRTPLPSAPDSPDLTEGVDAGAESPEDAALLRVRRPELTPCPEPPANVRDWLRSGWDGIDGAVVVHQPGIQSAGDGKSPPRFEDDPSRVAAFEEWRSRREVWIEQERPAHQSMAVFQRLYELKARLDREPENLELLVGDGLLDWALPDGSVHHPILLKRLELHFDPEIPEFTLADSERPAELYESLLQAIPEVTTESIRQCRQDLDVSGAHPLGGEETLLFLRRLVIRLSAVGDVVDAPSPRPPDGVPYIARDPVLFLRPRTPGYGQFVERILEQLPTAESLPEAIQNIVGIEPLKEIAGSVSSAPESASNSDGEDEDVLFCKPANAEQLQIAHRLFRYGGVLVQGPPGTGKTHTIANLIGHLLAQGKSVLVTSHTSKALQVVRDQVPEALQPLCVSLLDESRKQMETAIETISERLSHSDPDSLTRRADVGTNERMNLLAELRRNRARLRDARADEYRPVVFAGEATPPSEAARWLHETNDQNNWIPGPVTPDTPLPLSRAEVAQLYQTNAQISIGDEQQIDASLPDPAILLTPDTFEQMAQEVSQLAGSGLDEGRNLWTHPPRDQSPETLDMLLGRLGGAVQDVDSAEPWLLEAMRCGLAGAGFRAPWEGLLKAISEAYERAGASRTSLSRFRVDVPDGMRHETPESLLDEIAAHLDLGGNLGWMSLLLKPRWKKLIHEARVDGHLPRNREEFEALRAWLRLEQARQDLSNLWQHLVADHGGPDVPSLGAEPEVNARQFDAPIQKALDWHPTVWMPLIRELADQGLHCEAIISTLPANLQACGELLCLRDAAKGPLFIALHQQIRRLQLAQHISNLKAVLATLAPYLAGSARAGLVEQIKAAITNLNPGAYRGAYDHLSSLYHRSSLLRQRRNLLARMEPAAPEWAAAIRGRLGIHGLDAPPGNPENAWRWRQMNDELDRRAGTSIEALQLEREGLKQRLRQCTTEIVEQRAWAAQARRTSLEQRQALLGWKEMIRRVGKGTGRRAPQFRAEAQKLMPLCQSAVPVWIMPLARVVESFDPCDNQFDVVIIDEASQADLMALSVLYMAKKVVVVGDPEQVSPLAIGEDVDEVQSLIRSHLEGIPNSTLYDSHTSIYRLAETSFGGAVMLREHFRCVRPIIEFSNQLSYDGKIKPLRDESGVVRRPYTVAYRVEAEGMARRVNETEALTVTALLMACAEQPEYEGATFGVISMVGEEQAHAIDDQLRRWMIPAEYVRRRVQCGNSAQFQGDERDVMFLSLCDTPGDGPLPLRREGADDMYKKRFNVAASRARDQMWVIHSIDPDTDLKPEDLRRRLILHAQNPDQFLSNLAARERETESVFEQQVLGHLMRAGYRVVPQWPVGSYRIDLVVDGGGKRLAVECDGDRWHTPENLDADMERQSILERLGWTFVRLRGSQFFRDPDGAMTAVFERLQVLGIPPEGSAKEVPPAEPQDDELRERTTRRAAELQREWLGEALVDEPCVSQQTKATVTEPREGHRARTVLEPPAPPHAEAAGVGLWNDRQATRTAVEPGAGSDACGDQGTVRIEAEQLAPTDVIPLVYEDALRPGSNGHRQSEANPDIVPADTPAAPSIPDVIPYRTWAPRPTPDPYTTSLKERARALVEIVTAEGPITCRRAFQLYTRAAGGLRVSKNIRDSLHDAVARARRDGDLIVRRELPGSDRDSAILSIPGPGSPATLLRTRGDRELEDIPPSEIALVMRRLQEQASLSDDELFRAVLEHYDMKRMTSGVRNQLSRIKQSIGGLLAVQ